MKPAPPRHIWHKSTYSTGMNDNCVEVSLLAKGEALLRDSENPGATPLVFLPGVGFISCDYQAQGTTRLEEA